MPMARQSDAFGEADDVGRRKGARISLLRSSTVSSSKADV